MCICISKRRCEFSLIIKDKKYPIPINTVPSQSQRAGLAPTILLKSAVGTTLTGRPVAISENIILTIPSYTAACMRSRFV